MTELIKYIQHLPWNFWKAFLLVLVTFTSGSLFVNLLSNKLEVLMKKLELPAIGIPDIAAIVVILVLFVIFVVSLLFVYRERNIFLNSYALSQNESRAHKCMIMLVSPPPPNSIEKTQDGFPWTIKQDKKEAQLKGDNLGEDIEALKTARLRWNWQQLMRGIEPHKETLKMAYLIGSPGDEGSHKDLGNAEELICRYIKGIEEVIIDKGVDFEDFDELVKCIKDAVNVLQEKGMHEKDITVDVTGGQKITSIAGAIITLNNRTNFQYVSTYPDATGKHKVWEYDAVAESSFPTI